MSPYQKPSAASCSVFDGLRLTRSALVEGDAFGTGGIAPVLDFTIPPFADVIENVCLLSSATHHGHVMDIVRLAIQDIGSDIAAIT